MSAPAEQFPQSPTPYEVLGVSVDASEDDIRRAHRIAMRKTHPDYGGDAAQFAMVSEAFKLIGSPQDRAVFDAANSTNTPHRPASSASSHPARTQRRAAENEPKKMVVRPPLAEGPLTVSRGKKHSVVVDAALTQRRVLSGKKGNFGLFGKTSREAHQHLGQYLAQWAPTAMPAARIVQNLDPTKAGISGAGRINTAVLCGERVAIVEIVVVDPEVYTWDGRTLSARGRPVNLPAQHSAVASLKSALPDCEVEAFIALTTPEFNPLAPEVSATGPHDSASGLYESPEDMRGTTRALAMYFGLGASHHVLDRNTLGTLALMTL